MESPLRTAIPRVRGWLQGHWTLASVLALLGLLLLVALTAPRWAALLRRPLPEAAAAADVPAVPAPPEPALAGGGAAERRIRVKLYLGHPEERALVEEDREIPFSTDIARQVRAVLESLAEGSQGDLLPVLPEGTRVLDVFVRGGVAYVNLSAEASSGHEGGSVAELVTVYAIVNSVAMNFPAVRRVQITVDGEARSSLAGHIDITAPLAPDLSLLARAPFRPAPAPDAPQQGAGEGAPPESPKGVAR